MVADTCWLLFSDTFWLLMGLSITGAPDLVRRKDRQSTGCRTVIFVADPRYMFSLIIAF